MKKIRRLTALAMVACAAAPARAGFGMHVAHLAGAARIEHGRKAPTLPGEAAIQQGLALLARGQYTAAIDAFTKATEARPDDATYFLLGYAHYQRGFASGTPETADKRDAQRTIDAYQTAIALEPKLSHLSRPAKLYHTLGLSFEAVGQDGLAAQAYQRAAEREPDNALFPLYQARLSAKEGHPGAAAARTVAAFEKARAKDQDASLLRLFSTSPLFSVLRADDEIVGAVRPYQPKETVAASNNAASDGFGLRDSVAGTAPTARPEPRPEDQAVLVRMASANDSLQARQYRAAIEAYDTALKLNERSQTLSRSQLGIVNERLGTAYNRLGLASESIAYLQRALQYNPLDAAADYQLALAYAVLGRYQQSLHAINETLAASPSSGDLRRYVIQAKTDAELEPIRDLPGFAAIVERYTDRYRAAR